jgi:hypothetical protein
MAKALCCLATGRRSVPSINDEAVMQCHAPFMHRVTNSAKLTPTLQRSINVAEIAVRWTMRGFHGASFDPQTLVVLETAFDEAWLTLKAVGNWTVRPDELARSVLRLAMEGERDPVRLHDGALKGLLPAASWREGN